MTTLEMILGGLTAIGGTTGLGGLGVALVKRRSRREAADASVQRSQIIADERLQLAASDREERTEAKLWSRLEAVEAETKACHDKREADRIAHEEQRRKDHEACEQKIGDLDQTIRSLVGELASDARGRGELTGAHRLELITSTPPHGLTRPQLPPAPKRAPRDTTTGTAPGEDPR